MHALHSRGWVEWINYWFYHEDIMTALDKPKSQLLEGPNSYPRDTAKSPEWDFTLAETTKWYGPQRMSWLIWIGWASNIASCLPLRLTIICPLWKPALKQGLQAIPSRTYLTKQSRTAVWVSYPNQPLQEPKSTSVPCQDDHMLPDQLDICSLC